jgi:hypothetical protein
MDTPTFTFTEEGCKVCMTSGYVISFCGDESYEHVCPLCNGKGTILTFDFDEVA